MDQLWLPVRYLLDHPGAALGVALGLGVMYWLLNRKPKMARDAERRMKEIREERGDPYNTMRPLR
jgi:hypothetical protein